MTSPDTKQLIERLLYAATYEIGPSTRLRDKATMLEAADALSALQQPDERDEEIARLREALESIAVDPMLSVNARLGPSEMRSVARTALGVDHG